MFKTVNAVGNYTVYTDTIMAGKQGSLEFHEQILKRIIPEELWQEVKVTDIEEEYLIPREGKMPFDSGIYKRAISLIRDLPMFMLSYETEDYVLLFLPKNLDDYQVSYFEQNYLEEKESGRLFLAFGVLEDGYSLSVYGGDELERAQSFQDIYTAILDRNIKKRVDSMLDKKYNHLEVENNKYTFWKENGYFESGKNNGKPFCVVIPPPNVTGKLHLGHAWNTALQDIMIRYKRMKGFDTLWVPGMDHAGIATQAKVDKKLRDMGIDPRSLKREEWLKYAWEWKEEYANNIHNQWAKLGLSLDYTKERFTLDEGLSKAVRKVFVTLYNEGLIYQGERMINWDPEARTALSNEEVIYKEVNGAFYHIKYPLKDSSLYLDVATTRPETMFGDMAVAVNKDDERYQEYIGKTVILPLVNREIPIIADDHADPTKGTGVVKITPKSDPNDYNVGLRHNLVGIDIMNLDGTMNENCLQYQGMDRFEAREALVAELKEKGFLLNIESIVHSAPYSERTDVLVEPIVSKQWFVKMRPLADKVLANQKNKDTKVKFLPSRYEKIMNHWMEITYDWCISRQLWWGHQIPAWYKNGEIYVGEEAPKEDGWVQDSDVLDTWFSSALWPFSTLGWPENTENYQKYYPNSVLVTGYDIIPFWVNRMTFQGLHFTGKRPFEYCYIHGLIRDKLGRKMSKSLGNGVDPMDVIASYGADSLRFYLSTMTAPGTDLRYDEEKVKSTWNFINKIWNASRFVMMNLEGLDLNASIELKETDKWILTKYQQTIKNVTKYMDKYEFQNVGTVLYDFIWDDFCDQYIEMAKGQMEDNTTKVVLYKILLGILKMLHPFMPFVTEEIYQKLDYTEGSIMLSDYPVYDKKEIFEEEKNKVDAQIAFIKAFRNVKAEHNIGKEYHVILQNKEDYQLIIGMLHLQDHMIDCSESVSQYIVSYENYSMILCDDKEETAEDILKKEKEIEQLKLSIQKRENLLNNENFCKKAPEQLVLEERKKLDAEQKRLKELQ